MTKRVTLDFSDIQSESDLHDQFSTAFGFPTYYGRNRDAFWDCVTSVPGNVEVVLLNATPTNTDLRQIAAEYLDILLQIQSESGGNLKVRLPS